MQKLHYTININSPKEKVCDIMLQIETYRKWTSAFNEGSYYKGSWEKGSRIEFLGPDPVTGEEGGMLSRIADYRPFEYVSIEHLGLIRNGIEDTNSEETKKWAPAFENYTFTEKDGVTTLEIEIESLEENAEMFNQMWPLGLKKLKKLAENS